MTFSVVINEKGGATEHKDFDKDEITIGRVKENDIVLPKNNISKRHVRMPRQNDHWMIHTAFLEFANKLKPDWLVCKLTEAGRAVIGG